MSFLCKFNRLWKSYFWSETEKKLFTVFAKQSTQSRNKDADIILIQCVEDYYYFSLFGQIIADLRKIKNIQVEQYVLRNFSIASYRRIQNFLDSKLFINRFTDKKWTNLYGAYCNSIAYSNEQSLGVFNDFKLLIKSKRIAKTLASKEELITLNYDNIQVGDLIYDTYLRFKPAPTVDLDDIYLIIVIWKALRNIKIAKKYFSMKKPKVLLQSYSTYIQHGVTARVALQYGVNVYTFGNYQMMVKKLGLEDYFHVISTAQYKSEFETFADKEEKYLEAECGLENRLSGKIDGSTSYMKESAYKTLEKQLPDVSNAVVVFLHDFYDSPHIYRSMIFTDFFEWIDFTINELEKNSTKYFLKPHPNQLPESGEVVTKLCNKHPNIKLLSPKITNKQLVNAGMKLGITVYGTVAHELAYMGVPIITCGDNPHSSYDFCFEAKNKKQYSEFIEEIDSLIVSNMEEFKEETKSFYYMHNLNKSDEEIALLDKLFLLRKFCSELKEKNNVKEYHNILNEITKNSEYKRFISTL